MISHAMGSGGLTTTEIQGSFSYQPFCVSTAHKHNIAFPPNADSPLDLFAAPEAQH